MSASSLANDTLRGFARELSRGVRRVCGGAIRFDAGDPDVPYVPLIGPGGRSDRQRLALAAAPTIVLFDESEWAFMGDVVRPDAQVVVCGLPVRKGGRRGSFDAPNPPERAVGAMNLVAGRQTPGLPGVTWVWGAGVTPLLDALAAWADGHVVVALPGTMPNRILTRGGVLAARTILEAMEATSFVQSNPAIANALAVRGSRVAAAQPSFDEVSDRAAEAVVLASGLV